ARMLLPKANLPATTALGVLDINDKKSVFDCGANVIMQKITPNNVKRLYEIYPSHLNDITIEDGRKEVENQIITLNKIPY
ncbi:MAG: [FeFe] hydrogenase H-cluster radical SAM maturase HydE, partial [Oscillospiraceae bacterium]